jgi:ABC-2 type transport system permease protein
MTWLKAYPTLLRVYYARSIEYRGQLLIWILSSVLPLVMMFVWVALAESQGSINGYGSADFISYYLMVTLFRRLTGAWIFWDVDSDIRTGTMSPQLLKPLHPLHHSLAKVLSSKPIQIAIVLPPIVLASLLLSSRYALHYDLRLFNLVWVALATWGALLLEFFAQAIIGSLAFWISHAVALADVWFWVRSFLSGWIIPLAMFPPGLQLALVFLPFRYCLAFPIEIILGALTPDQIAIGFVMQYAWVLIFFGLFQFVWRRGVKSYGAVGA